MMVTVVYFNHHEKRQERRDHSVADLERATIEQVVDLFDTQVGTVLAVYDGDHRLHRAAVNIGDLLA